MSKDKPIKQIDAEWQEIVLVCRKCSKKLEGGFGEKGEKTLAKSLRRAFGPRTKPRKATVAVVEVGCFDICPKGAVVTLRASNPSDWAVIPKGAAVDTVIDRLGLREVVGEAAE
ncbi:MAG TPA: hypothetical protein VL574_07525 [Stellaceae bacterium]|nr:hypothetical protein [Stellaceae bacterium]